MSSCNKLLRCTLVSCDVCPEWGIRWIYEENIDRFSLFIDPLLYSLCQTLCTVGQGLTQICNSVVSPTVLIIHLTVYITLLWQLLYVWFCYWQCILVYSINIIFDIIFIFNWSHAYYLKVLCKFIKIFMHNYYNNFRMYLMSFSNLPRPSTFWLNKGNTELLLQHILYHYLRMMLKLKMLAVSTNTTKSHWI